MHTLEQLQAALSYDPDTGIFTWIEPHSPRLKVGQIAGCVATVGYRYICVDQNKYLAHRLAILFTTGEWPEHDVDHVNCNRDDNRISNLRNATRTQNMLNRAGPQSNSSLGILGVSPCKNGKFKAQLSADGRHVHISEHETAEQAHAAYMEAKRKYHKH